LKEGEFVLLELAHSLLLPGLAMAGKTATLTAQTTICRVAMTARMPGGGPGIVAGIESDSTASTLATILK